MLTERLIKVKSILLLNSRLNNIKCFCCLYKFLEKVNQFYTITTFNSFLIILLLIIAPILHHTILVMVVQSTAGAGLYPVFNNELGERTLTIILVITAFAITIATAITRISWSVRGAVITHTLTGQPTFLFAIIHRIAFHAFHFSHFQFSLLI